MQSRILLLDEPTASITGNEIAILFNLLRRLKDEDVAILFLCHKLEEVFELCDKVIILRDGRNACESVSIKELDKQKIVSHMIGRNEDVGDIGKRQDKLGSIKLELNSGSTVRGHHHI